MLKIFWNSYLKTYPNIFIQCSFLSCLEFCSLSWIFFIFRLNINGKIIIFTLDPLNNEIPTFSIMKKKLKKALIRDKKIIRSISYLFNGKLIRGFSYKVKISRKKYMEMINSKYISVLLGMSQKTIFSGLNQIKRKYKKQISFEDKLICLVLNR